MPHLEDLGRHGLREHRVACERGVLGEDERGLVHREGGDVIRPLRLHHADELLVDELIADAVSQRIDTRLDERLRVGQVEDVRGDTDLVLVRLFDRGLEDVRLHLGKFPVHVVHPEFDHVRMV